MPINPSPAVVRAGQVLWYLAEHPSETHTVAQLSRTLSIPRATCDSILQALTQQGFVNRRGRDNAYELGASCLALAGAAQAANTVLSVANIQADSLARELQASVIVSTKIGGEARALSVYDRGPASAVRARVGHTIPVTPPFGVVFAAWEPDHGRAWLERGSADAEPADVERWSNALQFARRHGYSYSVAPGQDLPLGRLGRVLEDLVVSPDSEPSKRTRDELLVQMRHSDYLAPKEVADNEEVQLLQVVAPVFDETGRVAASMMVLGSLRPIRGAAIKDIAAKLMQAADRASAHARELRLREPGPAVV